MLVWKFSNFFFAINQAKLQKAHLIMGAVYPYQTRNRVIICIYFDIYSCINISENLFEAFVRSSKPHM